MNSLGLLTNHRASLCVYLIIIIFSVRVFAHRALDMTTLLRPIVYISVDI